MIFDYKEGINEVEKEEKVEEEELNNKEEHESVPSATEKAEGHFDREQEEISCKGEAEKETVKEAVEEEKEENEEEKETVKASFQRQKTCSYS